jgi:hypothetical protein
MISLKNIPLHHEREIPAGRPSSQQRTCTGWRFGRGYARCGPPQWRLQGRASACHVWLS